MSESVTAAPTFSQPSSPTTGLAAYDLEGAKSLYPGNGRNRRPPLSGRQLRLARLLRRKHLSKKDAPMPYLAAMVGTLQQSVGQIIASNSPNQDALLKQTFTEFSEELAKAEPDVSAIEDDVLNKLESEGMLAIPLFKGMGAVGAIANLVSMLTDKVMCIQNGFEYSGQTEPGPNSDPASPEIASMLDHLVGMAEMILRSAVNEHVEPLGDDEDADHLEDGFHLVVVPSADHPGSAEHAIVAKSYLVEDLRKFATDPVALQDSAFETGLNIFQLAGVDAVELNKALQGGDLAKTFAPGGSPADGSSVPDDGTGGGDATDSGGGALPSQDDENPLDVMGRLLALCMVQFDHIQQMVDGTDEPIDDAQAGDQGNDGAQTGTGGDQSAAPAAPPVGKAAETGALFKVEGGSIDQQVGESLAKLDPVVRTALADVLAKAAESEAELVKLRSEAEQTGQMVKDLLARPEVPKAHSGVGLAALSKAGDTDATTALEEQRAAVVGRMEKGDEVLDLIKAAQKKPVRI